MATKERDVVFTSRDEAGNPTIDLPITRLANVEDGAEVKPAPGAGDYLPLLDGADGGQMKKSPWNPAAWGGIPIVTTYTPEGGTAGIDYAVDVPGVGELCEGLLLRVKLHTANTRMAIVLSLNGGDKKNILRPVPGIRAASYAPDNGALKGGEVYLLQYRAGDVNCPDIGLIYGGYWVLLEAAKANAKDVHGIATPMHGGTGLDVLDAGHYLVGNGDEPLQLKTPAEVAADIGPHINPVQVGGIPIVTTYTPEGGVDGVDYAADVPGVGEPYHGLTLRMAFHVSSSSRIPKLSINGLGAVSLRRTNSDNAALAAGPTEDWLRFDRIYTFTYLVLPSASVTWVTSDSVTLVANRLSGVVAITNGGTGAATAEAARANLGIGSGKRTCRFVVGTSTAGWTAADCDYLCDGTDDQVEINAAIQALPATGGEVVILDGTYNITAAILVSKDNTKIMGNGYATKLYRKWAASDHNGIITIRASYCKVSCLYLKSDISLYHNYNHCICGLSGTTLEVTGVSCEGGEYGIYSVGDHSLIWGCICSRSINGGISGSGKNIVVSGNRIIGCAICVGGNSNSVSNNTVYGDGKVFSAISINWATQIIIATNVLLDIKQDAILLQNTERSNVIGNICIAGTGTASDYGTYQRTIRLMGTANKNNLIAYNSIMGKNYVSEGGTGNIFIGNKYN